MSHPPKPPLRFVPTLTEVVAEHQPTPGSVLHEDGHPATEPVAVPELVLPPAPPPRPTLLASPAAHAKHSPATSPSPTLPTGSVPPPVPTPAPAATLLSEALQAQVVQRVMERVAPVLQERLHAAITHVLQEQTQLALERLGQEVEGVVRQVVREALSPPPTARRPPR